MSSTVHQPRVPILSADVGAPAATATPLPVSYSRPVLQATMPFLLQSLGHTAKDVGAEAIRARRNGRVDQKIRARTSVPSPSHRLLRPVKSVVLHRRADVTGLADDRLGRCSRRTSSIEVGRTLETWTARR